MFHLCTYVQKQTPEVFLKKAVLEKKAYFMKKLSSTEVDLKKAAYNNMCNCLDFCILFLYIELRYIDNIRSNIQAYAKNSQITFFHKGRCDLSERNEKLFLVTVILNFTILNIKQNDSNKKEFLFPF